MKLAIAAAAFSLAATGMASAMTPAQAPLSGVNTLPIIKADVIKRTVIRHPPRHVVKKTVIRR